MSFQTIAVLSDVAVAAGTTNDPVAVKMDDSLTEAIVYIVNRGASTSLTVIINSSPDGSIKAPLQPVTLNATTATTAGIPVSIVPQYLVFNAVNNDASNATTYDVIISKRV